MEFLEKWNPKVLNYCKNLTEENARKLPFKKAVFQGIENSWLVMQSECYRMAKSKLPIWWNRGDLAFPDKIAMEQCSSELTSRWKSTLVPEGTSKFFDMTAGLGVDAWWMGKKAKTRLLFETNAERRNYLINNIFRLSGSRVIANSFDFILQIPLLEHYISDNSFIYLDPDRRPDGTRQWNWTETTPSISDFFGFSKMIKGKFLVKLSPMDNISDMLEKHTGANSIFVVSVQNEVKELLVLWNLSEMASETKYRVVEINKEGYFRNIQIPEQFNQIAEKEPIAGQYILDPLASMRKDFMAERWMSEQGFAPVSKKGQLFLSAVNPPDFPGRVFEIKEVVQDLKSFGHQTKGQPMQVITRNFPERPETIRSKYQWKEGEINFLICTQNERGEKKIYFCTRIRVEKIKENWNPLPL